MIRSRNSNDHLSKDMILDRITEIDIFNYYCSSFKGFGQKFCSELRKDTRPSASIIQWHDKLLYKDFGHPEHTFDCFGYVMQLFGCDFYSALRIIDNDFGLNLASYKTEMAFTYWFISVVKNGQDTIFSSYFYDS